jgi:hypothetical protein
MLLKDYLQDGADHQARAVLMALQGIGDIESSWDNEFKRYTAELNVARWENGREQGYVISLLRYRKAPPSSDQLNIAFFEHRNSDSIHAVKWLQHTFNSPTIDTAEFGEVYKTKFDTSFQVGPGEYEKMANWIFEQFEEFWEEGKE